MFSPKLAEMTSREVYDGDFRKSARKNLTFEYYMEGGITTLYLSNVITTVI